MSLENLRPAASTFVPGGVPTSAVLPPDYNPYAINPYAPGSKFNQGMMQPQQPTSYSAATRYYSPAPSSGFDQRDINNMSYEQLVRSARTGGLLYNNPNAPQQSMYNPYQGMFSPYSGGFNFPSQFGGVSYPQFNMFNPYSQGMFSGFGMQAPQQQADPYALPTQPFRNPFGGYTDYTGVNQDFIDARRNLIDALSSKAGMSPEQAVRAADNSTLLNSIVNSMGGRRYGESSTGDPDTSSTGAGL